MTKVSRGGVPSGLILRAHPLGKLRAGVEQITWKVNSSFMPTLRHLVNRTFRVAVKLYFFYF